MSLRALHIRGINDTADGYRPDIYRELKPDIYRENFPDIYREKLHSRSRREAKAAWKTNWTKGTLICRAANIRVLGLRFFETQAEDHFSVRCNNCDLNPNQVILPLCARLDGNQCSFDLLRSTPEGQIVPLGVLDELVKAFRVDEPPVP